MDFFFFRGGGVVIGWQRRPAITFSPSVSAETFTVKPWFSLATEAQTQAQAGAEAAYATENERRHKHQNQPRQPPFCSNAQTRRTWNECFNWPDATNCLVLMLRFVFTRRKRRQSLAQAQTQGEGRILILVLALVLMLAPTSVSR